MRILTGILAALTVGISSVALAETNGWYVGAEGGANFVPEETFKAGDGTNSWKESHDTGYGLLGQAGYGFGPLRAEGELGWRSNGVSKATQNGLVTGNGDLDVISLMANVYYDVNTGTAFTPYVGVGIGGANLRAHHIRGTAANGASGTLTKDDDYVFAYQGILGGSYAINDALSLNADYRYFRTTEANLKLDPVWTTGGRDDSAKVTYQSHGVFVGFTYKLGATPKAAPVPAK